MTKERVAIKMKPKEVENWLGVSRTTIYRWRLNDGMPSIKLKKNGSVRFDMHDVDLWMKRRDSQDG